MLNLPKLTENEFAANLYWESRTAEITARRQWADEEALNELGYIPLSCSLPTKAELAKLRERQAESNRLNVHCPHCGSRCTDFIDWQPGTPPRTAQCWNCKQVFPIGGTGKA